MTQAATARQARILSNKEIRMPGQNISGRVINVTAWKDEDKDGGHYGVYISEFGKPGSDLQLKSF